MRLWFLVPIVILSYAVLAFSAQEQEPETYHSSFEVVQLAYTDILTVIKLNDPEIDPHFVRYIDLRTVTRSKRMKLKKALDFVLNSLNSQYRPIVRAAVIPNDKDPVLIRVNLYELGIDPAAWDFLAENGSGPNGLPDPFYHKLIEKLTTEATKEEEYTEEVPREEQVRGSNGQIYTRTWTEKVTKKKTIPGKQTKNKIYASAPWLAVEPIVEERGKTISALIEATNTKNPILNGPWFLTYSTWPPAYWKLIGLKGTIEKNNATKVFSIKGGEKEFEDLVGFDRERTKKSQLASIADSKIVTLHNRILIRKPTVNGLVSGYYWASFDTDNGIDDQDYMNNIDNFDNPKIVAKEIIATALNTFQLYAVSDANGNLVSEANPKVAIHGDKMPTKLQDKVIYSGLRNCALCHNEGIIPIDDRVRDLAQDQIALLIVDKLKKESKEKDRLLIRKVKDAFSPNLKEVVKFDNAMHAAAILACNGLSPAENKEVLEEFIVDYLDSYITLEQAALEAGWPVGKLEDALKKAVGVDYTVTMLLNKKVKASRLAWERQGFASMMDFLLTQPAPAK